MVIKESAANIPQMFSGLSQLNFIADATKREEPTELRNIPCLGGMLAAIAQSLD